MTSAAVKDAPPMRASDHADASSVRASLSIDTFQYLVDKCAKLRLNQEIANGSAEHARVLIAKLFEIARSDVRLVSGHLRVETAKGVEIYGHKPVIDAAKKFLRDPNAHLSITVQGSEVDRGDDNIFLKSVVEDPSRNGKITVYVPAFGELKKDDTPHYMVADREAYRFETGVDASPTQTSIVAIANFGDPRTAEDLSDLYSETIEYLDEPNRQTIRRTFEPGEMFSLMASAA